MSQRKRLLDRVTNFIFGPPISIINDGDLQLIRDLSQRLETISHKASDQHPSPSAVDQRPDGLAELAKQVEKLAKTQFKTNTLHETQLTQYQDTLTRLERSFEQQEKLVGDLQQHRQQAIEAAQMAVLKEMLPVIDGLDAAFDTGRRQVLKLSLTPDVRPAIVAWLDGIRLARLRILDVFASHDITPIPTVGQPFDPHYHIAVATDNSGRAADGIIVSQDRTGYATPARVLREAEVVVARRKG